jgi:hypothetical protein
MSRPARCGIDTTRGLDAATDDQEQLVAEQRGCPVRNRESIETSRPVVLTTPPH